jgi:hypothetical protein
LQVGDELTERRDADPGRGQPLTTTPTEPPELAVVEGDGGRIRTRLPGHGPGVHWKGEGWRESKNACLIKAARKTFAHDPQPEPPACFLNPEHVVKLAQTAALSTAAPPSARDASTRDASTCDGPDHFANRADEDPFVDESPPPAAASEPAASEPAASERAVDWRPKRLVRTVLSSMADTHTFGKQMQREARLRRFDEAVTMCEIGRGCIWGTGCRATGRSGGNGSRRTRRSSI